MDTNKEQPKSVTLERVLSVIEDTTVLYPENTNMCIVVLHLKNGAKATGVSYGTIDPKDNDKERGMIIAKEEAIKKVFELENYLLRQETFIYNILLNNTAGTYSFG
jgi:hypothetical protein